MSTLPKIVAIITMVAGAIMAVVGVTTFLLVQRELADENVTVADDAENFAGEPVEGPFTAYAQATVIKDHAIEAGGGLTYAELDREDPARDTVMNASFLRASLFTSVVAFGVSALLVGLGLLVILIGLGMFALDRRGAIVIGDTASTTRSPAPAEETAAAPA
ncbi:MAG: aromatic ring-opening dioxygenase LigA [Actinomycetota bacterium]|nr:aromatic ring-opening dioxygenase LigA [Actinomycetota bacterium]